MHDMDARDLERQKHDIKLCSTCFVWAEAGKQQKNRFPELFLSILRFPEIKTKRKSMNSVSCNISGRYANRETKLN